MGSIIARIQGVARTDVQSLGSRAAPEPILDAPCPPAALLYGTVAHRLLIVDDERTALRYLARFFQAKGFEVAQAADGRSGIEQFAEFSPDVVLLDLRLPDADGMELLPRFKKADPS